MASSPTAKKQGPEQVCELGLDVQHSEKNWTIVGWLHKSGHEGKESWAWEPFTYRSMQKRRAE